MLQPVSSMQLGLTKPSPNFLAIQAAASSSGCPPTHTHTSGVEIAPEQGLVPENLELRVWSTLLWKAVLLLVTRQLCQSFPRKQHQSFSLLS